MSRPPVSELLVPAPCLAGAADTDRGPPYGRMSIGVHHDLLISFLSAATCCAGQFYRPPA
jgi:hypothetical protein